MHGARILSGFCVSESCLSKSRRKSGIQRTLTEIDPPLTWYYLLEEALKSDSSGPVQVNDERPTRIAFGLFEADLQSGELWKSGHRVKLESQPFRVLGVLLENAGQVVTREELEHKIWGPNVVVDFDHALGSAIKKVRQALGDSATNPRFVETLSRRGYRFIAPVQPLVASAETQVDESPKMFSDVGRSPAEAEGNNNSGPIPASSHPSRIYVWVALAFIVGVSITWLMLHTHSQHGATDNLPRIERVTREGLIHIPESSQHGTFPALAIDGDRLFASTLDDGKAELRQIYIPTGENRPLPLPGEVGEPEICDISRDGTKLLVRSHSSSHNLEALWIVPVDGGAPFRLAGVLAQDAAWMPDGKSVIYASGKKLATISLDGLTRSNFADLPGEAFWLRWSPGGDALRFTMRDLSKHRTALWEIGSNSRSLQPVLPDWPGNSDTCCGIWTVDGRYFVFQGTLNGHTDLWKIGAAGHGKPAMLTHGPHNFGAPARGAAGGRIFFIGGDSKSETIQFDFKQLRSEPLPGFLNRARFVSFSDDGQRVAWIDLSGRLWRARSDGTNMFPITPESLTVVCADWAPDAAHILFSAQTADGLSRVFLISTGGGEPRRALEGESRGEDPSYAPDGQRIVFRQYADQNSLSQLKIFNLATHRIEEVSGSQGMLSPRWSPKGGYIAARTPEGKLALYSLTDRKWTTPTDIPAQYLFWSADGESIIFQSGLDNARRVYRMNVPSGTPSEVFIRNAPPPWFRISGTGPSNRLYLHSDGFLADVFWANLSSD